jgi:hypothetical protein
MLQNEPQRLPPFHFVADQDPDPAFTVLRIRIRTYPAFHFDADPDLQH